ncbi:MAG: hypothetical protein Q9215_005373 [Flavoplaca cf. flavocitrina]
MTRNYNRWISDYNTLRARPLFETQRNVKVHIQLQFSAPTTHQNHLTVLGCIASSINNHQNHLKDLGLTYRFFN